MDNISTDTTGQLLHAREAFRHNSYLSPAAKAVMCGFGVQGYPLAIAGLAAMAV